MAKAAKLLTDPVHGTIGLSDVEVAVLETRTFQRLRNVRQLGLAHYVYPGADYSRFSHSVGACHLAGEVFDVLESAGCLAGRPTGERQIVRLAALLHDVGHYPFSHATEHAAQLVFADQMTVGGGQAKTPQTIMRHESVGALILECDTEIRAVLDKHAIAPQAVSGVFRREDPMSLCSIISSDLDVDRIDYLLRTAHHTGLPYGNVDVKYLIGQMRLDRDNRLCLTGKAIRAAEHLLIARYLDYRQVAFHKTVAGLEWALQSTLTSMARLGLLDCSQAAVRQLILSGDWAQFHDASMMQAIAKFASEKPGRSAVTLAEAILFRQPPIRLAEIEYFDSRNKKDEFKLLRHRFRETSSRVATEFEIDPERLHVWERDGVALTKIGSHVPVDDLEESDGKLMSRYEEAVRILKDGRKSEDIMSERKSLMSVIADSALYAIRLYLAPTASEREKRDVICKRAQDLVNA